MTLKSEITTDQSQQRNTVTNQSNQSDVSPRFDAFSLWLALLSLTLFFTVCSVWCYFFLFNMQKLARHEWIEYCLTFDIEAAGTCVLFIISIHVLLLTTLTKFNLMLAEETYRKKLVTFEMWFLARYNFVNECWMLLQSVDRFNVSDLKTGGSRKLYNSCSFCKYL